MFKYLLAPAATLVLVLAVGMVPSPAEAAPRLRPFEVWYRSSPNANPQLAATYADLDRAQREAANLRGHGYFAWVKTSHSHGPFGGPFQVMAKYTPRGEAFLAGAYYSRAEADREAWVLRGYGYSSWVRKV